MKKLEPEEIKEELQKLNEWKLIDGRISKEFRFDNFPNAVLFLNKLVDPVEELCHYPEIIIRYNRVRVTLITHTAGAITEQDCLLARRIDELV